MTPPCELMHRAIREAAETGEPVLVHYDLMPSWESWQTIRASRRDGVLVVEFEPTKRKEEQR